jgi:hypothetical protein
VVAAIVEEDEAMVAIVEETADTVATVAEERHAGETAMEGKKAIANASPTTTSTTRHGTPCLPKQRPPTLPNATPNGVRQPPLELAAPAKSLLIPKRNPHPLN